MNEQTFLHWCNSWVAPQDNALSKPLIMGVLNITPDSFSDGGHYLSPNVAFDRAYALIEQGADIIDIGGESSKPGVKPVSLNEELDRVLPVIEQLATQTDTVLSIDTYKAEVMHAAVSAGVRMINDINALQSEGALDMAARLDVPICLMHMQGKPESMQINPHYEQSVIQDVNDFFHERMKACVDAGIQKERIILDPGFGFGKTVQHNLQLLKHFNTFHVHQRPVLLGVSRKSTLGAILKKEVHERLIGGLTMAVFAALQGMAIIRTHDVEETKQAFQVLDVIRES